MNDGLNIIASRNKKLFKLFISCMALCILTTSTFSINVQAEEAKEGRKPERIVKRKIPEKKSSSAHSDTIKAPGALESTHSFPSETEQAPAQENVEAVILLDSSRSMQKTDPKRIRDQGAKLFLQFLEPEDKAAIVEFSDKANVLMDLKPIKGTSIEEINGILEGIKNEGNFTNFIPPLESALELLTSSEDINASKVIVLLTDGQMDPGTSAEQRDQLIENIIKEKIPEIHKKRIKVFTIGLSELADNSLLGEIAKKTSGHSEYAKDVNSIHKIFSDLFLSIKKPQVLELESGGFSIDGNTGEATFFINRLSEADSITVIDPTGNEYTNKDFPPRWKWFRGDLFDVITVPAPLPGRWGIKGGTGDLSGFAKLLSDLKLEYSFPAQSYSIGDSAVVKVRLTEGGKIIEDPNFVGLIFYSFKIINSKTGQLYLQGQLADKGDRGDDKAADGIFADIITLNEEGEFKLFLVATAPTFTRQAHIPFSVSKGIISLEHVPPNEFTGAKEAYRVHLFAQGKTLTKRIVVADAKVKEEKNQINLEKYKLEPDLYEIPLEKLKLGENKVVAIVQGLDESKKEIRAKSEEVTINVTPQHAEKGIEHIEGGHATEETSTTEKKIDEHLEAESIDTEKIASDDGEVLVDGENTEEGEVVKPSQESNLIFGVIGVLISIVTSFFLGRLFIKKSKTDGGSTVVVREEYQIPPSLKDQLEVIQSKTGSELRPFYPNEMAIFGDIASSGAMEQATDDKGSNLTESASTEQNEETAVVESSEDAEGGDNNEE